MRTSNTYCSCIHECVRAHTLSFACPGPRVLCCKNCKDIAALVRAQVSSGTQGSEGEVMLNPQPGVLVYDFPLSEYRGSPSLRLNFFPTEKNNFIFPDTTAPELDIAGE